MSYSGRMQITETAVVPVCGRCGKEMPSVFFIVDSMTLCAWCKDRIAQAHCPGCRCFDR